MLEVKFLALSPYIYISTSVNWANIVLWLYFRINAFSLPNYTDY
jgi:hypothetical protein